MLVGRVVGVDRKEYLANDFLIRSGVSEWYPTQHVGPRGNLDARNLGARAERPGHQPDAKQKTTRRSQNSERGSRLRCKPGIRKPSGKAGKPKYHRQIISMFCDRGGPLCQDLLKPPAAAASCNSWPGVRCWRAGGFPRLPEKVPRRGFRTR